MRRFFKILAVLIIAIIVAAVAAILLVDPNSQKDRIADAVQDAIGRDLVIGGDIEFNPGLATSVSLSDVTLSNADWGTGPQMVTFKRLEAEVGVLPLITGTIQINRLFLEGAEILLETDASGTPNWQFKSPAGDGGSDDDADEGKGGEPKLPILKDLLIQNVSLIYRDGVTGDSKTFKLEKLALQGEGPDDPMKLDLAATLDDIPITASGQLGAANALTRNESFPISLTLDALGFAVGLDGAIGKPAEGDDIDLTLTVNAEDLSGLAPLAGDGLPTAGPLELSTNLRGGPAAIALEDIALIFGATDLGGRIEAVTQGARPKISGTITAQQIDLTELIPAGSKADAAAPASTDTAATSDDGPKKVFPSDPLPLDGLKAIDVDLAVRIAHLITPSIAADNIAVDIALDNGDLAVNPFAATIADSALTGDFGLTGSQEVPGLTVNLKGPQLNIGQILLEASGLEMLRGEGALDIELTSAGQSVAALMGGLNGHARLLMEDGQAKTESFDLLIGGLTSVVGGLFGGQDEWTVLECLATNFTFENGVGTSGILMDTEFVSIIGEGGMNLGDETLDMKVTPQSKSATLSAAVPINIGGTFAEPSFAPDGLAAARKIGGLLGATLFPPAALLALGDLGAGENSCVDAAAAEPAAGEQPAAAVPTEVPASAEGLKGAVESLGEGLGKGIKGLLGN